MKREQYLTPTLRILDLAVAQHFLASSTSMDSTAESLDILDDDSSNWTN